MTLYMSCFPPIEHPGKLCPHCGQEYLFRYNDQYYCNCGQNGELLTLMNDFIHAVIFHQDQEMINAYIDRRLADRMVNVDQITQLQTRMDDLEELSNLIYKMVEGKRGGNYQREN